MIEEWLKQIIEIGITLNSSNMRRGIDQMIITLCPEYGFVNVEAYKNGNLTTARRFDQFPDVKITKIAPQDAATSTGARNK